MKVEEYTYFYKETVFNKIQSQNRENFKKIIGKYLASVASKLVDACEILRN